MKKIAIVGAAGRMGRRLVSCVANDPETQLIAAVEAEASAFVGRDAGLVAGLAESGLAIIHDRHAAARAADVLIDFSAATATIGNVEIAVEYKTPIVIGTTGLGKEQQVSVRRLAEKIPVVMAPNMSVGVNLMWRLLEQAAQVLQDDYDIEIVEAHHRHKKDAPSGTAMRCAEVLARTLGRDLARDAVYHREGLIGERGAREIGLQTIRGGDIIGEHTVYFAGIGERLEITHRASSRDTFAKGAIRAAKWVIGQKPGLYDMHDVLGLK